MRVIYQKSSYHKRVSLARLWAACLGFSRDEILRMIDGLAIPYAVSTLHVERVRVSLARIAMRRAGGI